ncbi:Methylated-DNA--protein-cysteine methyltransferase, constitutive [bioreactor metagenome]|uniref:methylated-DNA--[protein]-cysteine S-methyltransferase n=1 Tax=bioreactor metagenome TaxID=1076179 RepID=A0A644WJF7_9ZZZZ
MNFILFDTPIGKLGLCQQENALTRLCLPGEVAPYAVTDETALLALGRNQLLEYFAGRRREFELPFETGGTAFQRKVWTALSQIPYGKTFSYGELAAQIGTPRGARAVGQANHHNPLPIFIPCHRVVGALGGLGGYGGGLALKKALLDLESQYSTKGESQ